MSNASEQFRASMSHLADVSESRDAAQAEFLRKEGERSSLDPRAPATPPAEEAEAVGAAEPVEAEAAGLAEGAAEAVEAAEPEAEEAEAVEAAGDGDLVELEDGTQVPLTELVKGNLRQSDYTRKTQDLALEKQQFEAQKQQVAAQSQEAMQRTMQIAQSLEAALAKTRPSPQAMAELRDADPAEWAARNTEFEQQRKLIALANAEGERIQREAQAAAIPHQRQALATVNPAFAENFDAEYQELGEYAISPDGGGLHREEWDQVVDHRHINLVWKAREYDKATRKAPRLPRKLAKVPKVLRPGSPREPGDTAAEGLSAALAHQRSEGGTFNATVDAFRAKESLRRVR